MEKRPRIVVGLDVGTSKVAIVVGEVSDDGAVDIVGIGRGDLKGIRGGVVTDVDSVADAIKQARHDAEVMTGIEIRQVHLGLSSASVRTFNSRGVVSVSRNNREITEDDVKRAVGAASAVRLSDGHQILHVLPQDFVVDEQQGIAVPMGITGSRLQANVLVITVNSAAVQSLIACVNRAGVEVVETILDPLAAGEAVLTADEMELGVCLVDIGGGTSNISVFDRGRLRHTGVLAIGGNDFTHDISTRLRLSFPDAERVKRRSGEVIPSLEAKADDEVIQITRDRDGVPRTISGPAVASILRLRAEELCYLLVDEIRHAGFDRSLNSGIVLTGGGAMLEGLLETTERIFDLPVRRGLPEGVGGRVGAINDPALATAVGLTLWSDHETFPLGRISAQVLCRMVDRVAVRKPARRLRRVPASDPMHVSITAPVEVAPEAAFVLDVWIHLESQRDEVVSRARDGQLAERILIRQQGPFRVAYGTALGVQVRLEGMIVAEPQAIVLWEGDIASASFLVRVPRRTVAGGKPGIVTISAEGLEIAKLSFVLAVGVSVHPQTLMAARSRFHRTAFASYASDDRETVLNIIQGMQKTAPGLDVFLDVAGLRSGERWAERLEQEIPNRDVFYLFWSEPASRSTWVEREWRCAYEHRGLEFIDPVPLVSPSVVPPPRELADLHFNDWVLAFKRRRLEDH